MSPPAEKQSVSARAAALRTLASELSRDAEGFHGKASQITEGMLRGAAADRAYGADSRNVPAVQAVNAYTDVSDDARRFLRDVSAGLRGIGESVSAIAGALGDQDDDNADRVRRVLGLDGSTASDNA